MQKTTLLLLVLLTVSGFSQTKSTGTVQLLSNTTAKLDLDSATSTATLTLTGPSDRWFALQFGSFDGPPAGETDGGDGMAAGTDFVFWNGTEIIDARHIGYAQIPSNDTVNNWITGTVTPNSPSAGLTTVVATRPFTGDANDYTFNFANSLIDFAFARRSSAGFALNNHNPSNRGYAINVPFTTLGVEDFSLNAATVFPNPSNGNFTVKSKSDLEKINVYSQTGTFIKTVDVTNNAQEVEVKLSGLATGVYLIELQNASEKAWKKIVIK
ncbi:T9SS type A sorting domain-containing protein [Flavobacterium aurantiibacter]|uniref:Secretion system C-terminal sorting domain-containing protein n=1 Tax=Flavobacterium aurantiibacter TaxID=2023067 RepID=A0A255ZY98_9FLAO|nr:T9SS type A sorting domain-containing protein [Flavobacterium aurantiibacter]OYQ46382.1 hypothetical protein CHX27_04575 [Flavobacterium aurantiibacter]